MKIINLSNIFYYPKENLKQNLEKLIIFPEDIRGDIPNGSVFIYKRYIPYNPEILGSDVGCGIASIITEELSGLNKEDVIRAVSNIKKHIGQGNHFLDITTSHPLTDHSSMIFLHSDFNYDNQTPKNYKQALQFQKDAKEKRIEYLDKLSRKLGVKYQFYKDWMHNSVELTDDEIIYRKGVINLKETDNIGLLALNPRLGFMLYSGDFSDYHNSVQHGIISKEQYQLFKEQEIIKNSNKYIKTKAYLNELKEFNIPHELDDFINKFYDEFSLIGFIVPYIIIKTKNKNLD